MPDQRSLLRGRLASAIDGVADVASRLDPPATPTKTPPTSPPRESSGRPWTLAAAMEPISSPVVERVAPQRLPLATRPLELPPPLENHRSMVTVLIISSIVALVLILVIALRLLSGSTPARSPAPASGRIALTGVRPVAAAPPAGGSLQPTQVSFPAKTSMVDIELYSGKATGEAAVHVVVTVGQPAQTIIQSDFLLNQSGDTVIPLTPASGTFAPGDYSVTITYKGAVLGSTAFAVH